MQTNRLQLYSMLGVQCFMGLQNVIVHTLQGCLSSWSDTHSWVWRFILWWSLINDLHHLIVLWTS